MARKEVRRRAGLEGLRRNGRLFVKSKIGIVGIVIIVFFVGMAVFAPSLSDNDPVFGTNVAAPYSIPAWATLLPQYQNLAITYLPVSPVDFGSAVSPNKWVITGAPNGNITHTISREVPPAPIRFIPRNPTGSLLVNASIIPAVLNDTNPHLPGGQVFFTIKQSFELTSKPPTTFVINATVEPVEMSNVSAVYLNYIFITPTKNYSLSTVPPLGSLLVARNVKLIPEQVGTWVSAYFPANLLQTSGIKEFFGVPYPAKLIFKDQGNYTFVLQVQAVPSGDNPSISLRIASVNVKLFGGAFGILGSDKTGRDVWAAFVWGSQISLLIGVLSALGAVGLGTLLGLAAGYLGGFWDESLGRITDFFLVLPFLPLLIILTFILSQNSFLLKTIYTWVILLFTLLSWPTIAKIVRSQVLSVKERPYVEASRSLGAGTGHILLRHILPNVTGLVYSQVALSVSGFILLEAALDFLTVSLHPLDATSWGIMLTESLPDATANSAAGYVWWWFLPPGIAIAALSLAFVLVGFALDSIFNPRLRAR